MPAWDEGFWDSGTWDSPTLPPPLPTKKPKINRRTMASNPTPDNDDIALALSEDLADGDHALEVALGVKQNTEAAIRAAITAALAARAADTAAGLVVSEKFDLLQAADTAGTLTLTNCKLRLSKLFGQRFNPQWATTGWPDQSTAIPSTQDKRFTLLMSLKNYFTGNPSAESVDMDATAALCLAAHDTISDARAAVNAAENVQSDKLKDRKAAMKTLRKRIRGLIDELGTLMAEDDTRYETFGLNVPANPTAPLGITSLTLTNVAGHKILAEWTYATRMGGTRLKVQRVGTDANLVNAGTADGLEKVLEGFTAGTTVNVQVIPYNDAGDGPGSPVVSLVVT